MPTNKLSKLQVWELSKFINLNIEILEKENNAKMHLNAFKNNPLYNLNWVS